MTNKTVLTYLEHRPKHGAVIHCRTVPSPCPELKLTLPNPHACSPGHGGHVVLVQLTELCLARGQAFYLRTYWMGTKDVQLGILPDFYTL